MHKLTFFPLGNADCCLVDLTNGQKLLFDYAHCRNGDDETDLRIDLATALREDLEGRGYYDVVAFTHADDDHVHGASDFFFLDHAKKYQGDDRVKIRELWVPAAMILEGGLVGDAKVLQAEARHRLLDGKAIRVFSRPEELKQWLEEKGKKLEDVQHLITDAGKLIPGYSKDSQQVEFFVHSPFADSLHGDVIDRNQASLILQATFVCGTTETRVFFGSDADCDTLTHLVEVTKYHKNEKRLAWDVFKVPHHCSYLALSTEPGKDSTDPVSEADWLFQQGGSGGILVSTSKPIPSDDKDSQPPHRQAANYYKKRAKAIEGEFMVTMEHPKKTNPEPVVITICTVGATVKKTIAGAAATLTGRSAPRAG